ncbi:hypothetical protein DIPPA_31344 [Diplonema papillatum]|nr:hypothetical protein DIPPA_31344 [Diplonema papillatum]
MSAAPCANEIAVESHKRASPQFCYAVRRMNLYLCHAPARMGGTRGYFPMHYMLAYLIKHHRITKDDVLLANNALVYRSAEPGSDLRRDLQLLGRWAAKPAGPRLVWRETSPQEYPNGSYKKKVCCCTVDARINGTTRAIASLQGVGESTATHGGLPSA